MPEARYPGRGGQKKGEELRAHREKLRQLEVELLLARKVAREIEQAAHDLAERMDLVVKDVFKLPGL
jgi:hypothetical protein